MASSDMTWGEFKKLVDDCEEVDDDTLLWYIDVSFPDISQTNVVVEGELGLAVS